jgi:ubiquitin-like 1-activating enzyme E1 A
MRQFSHVIATDLPYPTLAALNAACRAAGRPFYAAAAHGAFGYVFADLLEHEFVVERASPNRRTAERAAGGRRWETATRRIVDVQIQEQDGQSGGRPAAAVVERVRKREAYSEIARGAGARNGVGLQGAAVANARKRRQVSPLLACVRALWALEAEEAESNGGADGPAAAAAVAAATIAARLRAGDADAVKRFAAHAARAHAALGLPAETLRADLVARFARGAGVELGPAAAMLGGLLAQDAVNVIGGREQPVQNLCIFDGEAYQVPVYALHPAGVGRAEGERNGNGAVAAAKGDGDAVGGAAAEDVVIVL